jgi:outer membrane protein OmpA-like peptidoglycan-associated protein/Tfp pilus assembly protein PilF
MKTILRHTFLFLITNFLFLISKAQWYDPQKVNTKAVAKFTTAMQAADEIKYADAINGVTEALKIEPRYLDAWLSRANLYAEIKNYKLSVTDFETAFQLDSAYAEEYYFQYANSLAGLGRFTDAMTAIDHFMADPKLGKTTMDAAAKRKASYQFSLDYDKAHPQKNYVFAPQNMGDSINTTALEYYPSLSIDEKKMIFTRRKNGDEDFYETNFINGVWSKATPVGGKINTNLNEGAQNVSQDGQWMIFAGCGYPEGYGDCDLYISYRTANGWTEPQNLGGFVNTEAWESSPSLSADKRDLYFASNFGEGYGGRDIYVTHHLSNGKWSRPVNLGPTINTKGDESCPFIHADNQTLFFNSNGHPGYGKTDLFVARKINDSTFGKPENLGYPVNTVDDEGSLIVGADGRTAIYTSDPADTKGGLDLYTFQLREDVRPARTLWVKGKVFDKKTNAGLAGNIILTDIDSRNVTSNVQTDENGNYLATLPVGKNYAFNVNRKGYLFYSDQFMLAGNAPDSVYEVNIPLQPLEAGAAVVLKNIFFDSKQYTLKPESLAELDKLVQLMNENPQVKILIGGYTDNVGKPADNLLLSNNRGKAVVTYLVSKGIAAQRLSYKGFGEGNPLADNKTELGRAMNRRTEMSVISN